MLRRGRGLKFRLCVRGALKDRWGQGDGRKIWP